ncbi:MAG: GNAT family N-acetyltransferase [Candidatus Dormibacteraeota bacterium]|nr:GNAT family N-acetyltransferase [Candidatus Dormibacteraeota bacterium]
MRPASADDAAPISRLLLQLTHHRRPPDAVAASLASGVEQVLVAEQEGTVIGVASLQIHRMLHQERPAGRLTVLVVDRAHRRQGAGEALLDEVTKLAGLAGCSGIELTTATHREEAHRFYQRRGFQATSLKFWRPVER